MQGLDLPLSNCVWIRTSPGASPTSTYSAIPNTDNKIEYTLTADDVNCYISIRHAWVEEVPATETTPAANQVKVIQAEHALGPVTAGPARLMDLRILSRTAVLPSQGGSAGASGSTGEDSLEGAEGGLLQVHYCVVAQESYIGGKQGCSEFWWMKTYPDGRREELTKRLPISPTAPGSAHIAHAVQVNTRVESLADEWRQDPRVYVLRPEDVGCTLKVKCIPVRSDGYAGEVVTSKPSAVVVGEHGEVIPGAGAGAGGLEEEEGVIKEGAEQDTADVSMSATVSGSVLSPGHSPRA